MLQIIYMIKYKLMSCCCFSQSKHVKLFLARHLFRFIKIEYNFTKCIYLSTHCPCLPEFNQFDWLSLSCRLQKLKYNLMYLNVQRQTSLLAHKIIENREIIAKEKLKGIISKYNDGKIITSWNSFPDTKRCKQIMAFAILIFFSLAHSFRK